MNHKPCKGVIIIAPIQGWNSFLCGSQGSTLGYHIPPPRGSFRKLIFLPSMSNIT
jgi:hypothetical protein